MIEFGSARNISVGTAIVDRLTDRGHHVRVWNRTPEHARDARAAGAAGAMLAVTPVELVNASETVVSVLLDDAAVERIYLGAYGLMRGKTDGRLFIDMSTTISLTGSAGLASAALGGLFSGGVLAWSFLPSITLPIFQGGQLQANLDLATLQEDVNVAQYEKTIQTAFREVADGLAARGTYDDELVSLGRFTEAEQRSLNLSDLRFKNCVDNYLAVLMAQTALYNAQLTTVSVRLARA